MLGCGKTNKQKTFPRREVLAQINSTKQLRKYTNCGRHLHNLNEPSLCINLVWSVPLSMSRTYDLLPTNRGKKIIPFSRLCYMVKVKVFCKRSQSVDSELLKREIILGEPTQLIKWKSSKESRPFPGVRDSPAGLRSRSPRVLQSQETACCQPQP